jgi:U3 small nucleolar RNA-associated protein 5
LASLHKTIDARLAAHDRLLALNGRLELLVSQIDMRREEAVPESRLGSNAGATRYVEGESSDEMEVDEDAQDDEGSVEDVVLGSTSVEDDQSEDTVGDGDRPRIAGQLMELEAEESGSGRSGDDDDWESQQEEADSELDGFIVDDDEDDDEEDDAEEEVSE